MKRRIFVIAVLTAVMTGAVSVPVGVLAAGPTSPAPPASVVPPLRGDGPVTLPNGKVLPTKPAWVQESSVQAQMLAEHANDRPAFAPGGRPQPIGRNVASLSTAPGPETTVYSLGLATPGAAFATLAATTLPNGMRKEVFGFLPYWMLSDAELQWMQYQLVTTIAYFGVAARSDGSLATSSGGAPTAGWSGWNSSAMTNVTNAAHARGVRVVLTITMMAWDGGAEQAALLGNAGARAVLINNIVAAVRDRNADGVNLDFEPVFTPQRDQYTSFVRQLKAGLVAAGAGSYLTVDTTAGAATWSTGYDVAALTADGAADALFVMGYDYSWSGSSRAGGVAPLESPYILDVTDSVDDFLSLMPGSKIIWGVPYYGRTWQTTSDALNSLTRSGASGASKAYYYTGARDLAATYGRRWDDVGKVPWFTYYDSAKATWVQGYYDDPTSLTHKYDLVNARGLAGTGMWTLLMDQGDNALWNLLAAKFVTDTTPPDGGIRILPALTDASAIPVGWSAADVGSGVAFYSVQVRDLSSASWNTWLTGTTATSGYYVGVPGHSYEFRVSATDFRGNQQPWLASSPAPGSALAIGGFGRVLTDTLNVRSGAGTSFSAIDQLTKDALVAVLAGPIDAGGYAWYQVQFDFTEWPSSDYPRRGWVAAGPAGAPYLQPSVAPNVIRLSATATAATTYSPPAALVFKAGTHTGYQFNSSGAVTAQKSYTLPTDSGADTSTRTTIANQSGSWFYVTNGIWAGYWLKESSALFLYSATPATFSPARTVTFAAGTYVGYTFDGAGNVTGMKAATLSRWSTASTDARAIINGLSYLHIVNGIWAGYWILESSSTVLS